MPETSVENTSFRVVGTYLRVNEPFNEATTPNPGFNIPPFFKIPSLNVIHAGTAPTIEDYMKSLRGFLSEQDYTFDFVGLDDTMRPPRRILQSVRFGKTGDTIFEMNAGVLAGPTDGRPTLATAWQYYMFDLEKSGEVRQEVTDRAGFNQTEIKSNMRVIWRLIVTYLNEESSQAQLLSKLNY